MMRRLTFCGIFFLLGTSLLAQNFRAVDRHAKKAPKSISKSMTDLTAYLTKDYHTDLEKVRSIYTWIAHNIDYDDTAYKGDRKRVNRSNADILSRRQAVCFGYSTLFQEMCTIAGIDAESVHGYSKDIQTGKTNLSKLDHSWSAVRIEDSWHLLDITWASANGKESLEKYFLVVPKEMIQSHLPADPMWQLLDCPIPPQIFQKASSYVSAYLAIADTCFNYRDSINAYRQLPYLDQLMKRNENAYLFNPVKENEAAFGHMYMDYVSDLMDKAERLEANNKIDSIKAVHLEIILYCQKAERYIELYDSQKENLAYSHMNYAVALSRVLQNEEDTAPILEEMQEHFVRAKTILESLPTSFIIENALEQLSEYLEWARSY